MIKLDCVKKLVRIDTIDRAWIQVQDHNVMTSQICDYVKDKIWHQIRRQIWQQVAGQTWGLLKDMTLKYD